MKKSLKITLAIATVIVACLGAWIGLSQSKSEASNYYYANSFIRFDNTELKWDAVYAYCWNNETDSTVIEMKPSELNTYGCNIISNQYANILFKNTPGTDNWDKQTTDFTCPAGAGNFTFVPSTTTGKIEGSFVKGGTTVTVYYENASFDTPHIYFQVGNGSWTEEKGYEMSKKYNSENVYEATIFTNGQQVNCCFNNGDDAMAWDNNDGNNYVVEGKTHYSQATITGKDVTK